jgi:hypothetical protein
LILFTYSGRLNSQRAVKPWNFQGLAHFELGNRAPAYRIERTTMGEAELPGRRVFPPGLPRKKV